MKTVFIVDDEEHAVELLKEKLLSVTNYFDEIITFTNSMLAMNAILEVKPDLIFSDIEMPAISGLVLHKKIRELDIPLIYVTAYSTYAIDAVRLQAFDYLLKPVKESELQHSIERFIENCSKVKSKDITMPFDTFASKQKNKIAISTSEATYFLIIEDILKVEAESNYSKIYLTGDKQILVSKTLKYFEDQLGGVGFMRVHRSFLININHLESIINTEGGQLLMKDGSKIDISRTVITELRSLFS
ncbi:MAG: LytTR family DNA-binding domain-containing protein [Chitinophagales bacterium]|nr:LytTR family DNA-binding domain-containing protein [Chitinophagales bacterium]